MQSNYIKKLSGDFSNGIVTTYSEVVNFENNYVQYIRKLNFRTTTKNETKFQNFSSNFPTNLKK
jgi:hypothetical protein